MQFQRSPLAAANVTATLASGSAVTSTTDTASLVGGAAAAGTLPPNVPWSAVTARASLSFPLVATGIAAGATPLFVLLAATPGRRYLLRSHIISAAPTSLFAILIWRAGGANELLWQAYSPGAIPVAYPWGYFALGLGEGLTVGLYNNGAGAGITNAALTINCDYINA